MTQIERIRAIVVAVLIASCGGSGGRAADGGGDSAPTAFSIGGAVSGLSGSGLVLQNNGGNNLAINGNGDFLFTEKLPSGGMYSITVLTQPANPSQLCTVANGAGTATADVTDVAVTCSTTPPPVDNVLINGSFEANNFFIERDGFPRMDDVNGSAPTGWTRDSNNLAEYMRRSPPYLGVTIYNPADGEYFIAPHDGEWWEQTFATVPGAQYKLTYSSAYGAVWWSSFYYRPGRVQGTVTVVGNTPLWSGPLTGTAAAPEGTTLLDSPFVWSQHTANFTADSSSTTLRFAGPSEVDGGFIFVDAASVEGPRPAGPCTAGGPPSVTINTPPAGATQLSGVACNVDTSRIKVVIYVLTNQWYVQPLIAAPFTDIAANGMWTNSTHPWNTIVVLLVDPANYTPAPTEIANPALDSRVLASAQYPPSPTSVNFSGRTWGIKVSADPFDPGPNYWSSDPSAVHVTADGLHLKIVQVAGKWQSAEVFLLESLGYGTYTARVASRVDQLDQHTVAAPLFLYSGPTQELDNEYSGSGGLIPTPYNAQFVVQPYTVAENIDRYIQPPTAQFTTQMEWRADHVTFRSWTGWSTDPAAADIIHQWTYIGPDIPPPGQERVRMNLWLLNGSAPVSGTGDELVLDSFSYLP